MTQQMPLVSSSNGGIAKDLVIMVPETIVKRDGRVVAFDVERIEHAIERCFASFGRRPHTHVAELAQRAVNIIVAKTQANPPTVEEVQDTVELVLQAAGEFEAAKRYILYRAEHAKQRVERPIPASVREAFAASDEYFPSPLQKFQFFDKYSRFDYDKGRRETWLETVDRSLGFMHELAGDRLDSADYELVRNAILTMKAMPSMRLLAMAGPAARRNNIAIYNCSYLPVDSIDSFVEALIISMSGCGVGFSVENKYVEQLPRVLRQRGAAPIKFVVEDSAEGWAEALRFGIQTWFEGGDVQFDLSELRSAGAPLRIKGGRASGPEPFRVMLDFARSRILSRQGSTLRSLDAHDLMCAVGNAAVSGGVRRTALISLFDFDDYEMRRAKDGDFERENWQRWNANNSLVWPSHGLTQLEISQQVLEMVNSGRGEPGIFNRQGAIDMLPERRKPAEFGTNPCVTGETWIAVADGRGRVKMTDLVAEGRDVDVYTVKDEQLVIRTMRNPRKTGTNVPVYRVTFADGTHIRATANHRFVMRDGSEKTTAELMPNDALVAMTSFSYKKKGLPALAKTNYDVPASYRMLQFGIQRKPEIDLLGQQPDQITDLPVIFKNGRTYVERQCEECGRAFEVRLNRREQAVCGHECSLRLQYRLHGTVERKAQLNAAHSQRKAGMREQQVDIYNTLMVELNRHPSKHEWQDRCRIVGISPEISRVSSPFRSWSELEAMAGAVNHRVIAVEADGFEDVYTGTVDDTHTFFSIGCERSDSQGRTEMAYVLSWQCGEIILRPYQFCNLTAAVARADDTFDTLREKVEAAAIIGTIQSLATYFPGLRPQWQANCEEERLLGVDITGQMDSPAAQDPEIQQRLRHIAVETNREFANRLGINQSASVTCVKPSGNSSQLLDCSSGLHARWAKFYIRNVRVSAHSPLYKVLRDASVPMDPENGQTRENATTWVVHFPVKAPEGAITRNERSALQQCEYWLQNKLNWTEHNPSVTITYRPDEMIDMMKWIWEHRDVIGGMAFLPAFDANYAQMPYVEISEQEYERLIAEFPPIDFSKIYRYEEEDLTTAAQELACMSGSCEIDFL